MKKNKKSVLKAITTLALVFAMVAGITAGFKGKAKASRPGYYKITFSGNQIYNADNQPQSGKVSKINGNTTTWVTSYSVEYAAGARFSLPLQGKNGDYELLGFSKNPTTSTPEYRPGEVLYATENCTYYAIWKDITVRYTVIVSGCYPLTRNGYGYDGNNDGIADMVLQDAGVGGKSRFAGANRVHLNTYNKKYTYVFEGWEAKKSNGQWINVSGYTVQQALNKIGKPNETIIDVRAIIREVKR